jgi:hypothetical protein
VQLVGCTACGKTVDMGCTACGKAVDMGKVRYLLKYGCIALILIETLYPFWLSGCWNDDLAPRPPYHGAYQIEHFWRSDSLSKRPSNRFFKRFFFHRQPYFILQNENDEMQDFECDFDIINHKLTLFDVNHAIIGNFSTQETDDFAKITLTGRLAADSLHLIASKIYR